MSGAATIPSTSSLADQLQAAVVETVNQARKLAEETLLEKQGTSLDKALAEMARVREFVSAPSSILGSEMTKHGEIAEQVEVGVRRAQDALNDRVFTATFDGVGRTAPEDYLINGSLVQSKFINGTNNTLSHVLEHMEKYERFGRDGSFYHVPKDQYEIILKVLHGEPVEGLSEKTVRAISEKVAKIQEVTGQSFHEVVQPGVSNYAEVQRGVISETLDRHERDIRNENAKISERIFKDHEPGWSDAAKAVGGAAAVGAVVSLTTALIRKYQKEGKNPLKGQLNREDWTALGFDSLGGAAIGAVTGATVYSLTNFASMSAPLAGSFVAAAKGVAPLVRDYNNGSLTLGQLLDQGSLVCADVAIVGLCSAAGQALIPVPILGAVIGSLAGKVLSSILSSQLTKAAAAIEEYFSGMMAALDKAYLAVVERINLEFDRLGNLSKAAFDLTRNESLTGRSVEFARAVGVPEDKLLKSDEDLFNFFAA